MSVNFAFAVGLYTDISVIIFHYFTGLTHEI